MENSKLIYNVLKQVDWDFVLSSVKQLKFNLIKNKLTKDELVKDLSDTLKNVLETNKKYLVTDIWAISCERDGDHICLEVMFTPLIIWTDTYNKTNTKLDRVSRLEKRLKLALETENYEKVIEIQKSLAKLQPKSK